MVTDYIVLYDMNFNFLKFIEHPIGINNVVDITKYKMSF